MTFALTGPPRLSARGQHSARRVATSSCGAGVDMGLRPLPAVRDLTQDGRWSTYDASTQALQCLVCSFRERCARMGNTLRLPSPTKLARLGHFPPASQAGRPGVLCICFSLGVVSGADHRSRIPSPLPLRVAKTSRNHLNDEFTPLLPTWIGERF
jgi:hypothetical protein